MKYFDHKKIDDDVYKILSDNIRERLEFEWDRNRNKWMLTKKCKN